MRETSGDLWDFHARGTVVVVTTSGLVGRDGLARLGRGAAGQAGQRYPWFAARLGALIAAHGHRVQLVGERIVAFPVEHHPLERPDPGLIRRSAIELASLAQVGGWTFVALPRPGCGGGGLEWAEVKPLLAPFLDDRFVVVTRG
jgi:hypothetical protein